MSDKWLPAALGLYPQSLAPSVKRELYFSNSVRVNPGIKTHWTDLGALPIVTKLATGFLSQDMLIG